MFEKKWEEQIFKKKVTFNNLESAWQICGVPVICFS
jgi:hypothetical protein